MRTAELWLFEKADKDNDKAGESKGEEEGGGTVRNHTGDGLDDDDVDDDVDFDVDSVASEGDVPLEIDGVVDAATDAAVAAGASFSASIRTVGALGCCSCCLAAWLLLPPRRCSENVNAAMQRCCAVACLLACLRLLLQGLVQWIAIAVVVGRLWRWVVMQECDGGHCTLSSCSSLLPVVSLHGRLIVDQQRRERERKLELGCLGQWTACQIHLYTDLRIHNKVVNLSLTDCASPLTGSVSESGVSELTRWAASWALQERWIILIVLIYNIIDSPLRLYRRYFQNYHV